MWRAGLTEQRSEGVKGVSLGLGGGVNVPAGAKALGQEKGARILCGQRTAGEGKVQAVDL